TSGSARFHPYLQATSGSASLGVTGEEVANPRLSSVKSTSIYIEPVYSASTIIHSEFASGHDASAASTLEANPVKFDPNDSVSKQQDKTKSASEGLKTIHTKAETGNGSNYVEKEITLVKEEFNTSPNLSNSDDA
nr:hypothetical protein [Tanacetum cinerariifolium]